LGLNLPDSSTAIQPILIGDSQQAVAFSNRLLELGFLGECNSTAYCAGGGPRGYE